MRNGTRRPEVALAALLALAACSKPAVGPAVKPSASSSTGTPAVALSSATVNASTQVVVRLQITLDGTPATLAQATALQPSFTLAGLATEPVSGLPAWRSYVRTGANIPSLPVAGPGTPTTPVNLVLQNVKQPGAETVNPAGVSPPTGGTLADEGDGTLSYTFLAPLPSADDFGTPLTWTGSGETLRVGVFLAGTTGTSRTSATLDFVPNGSPPASRELVLDTNCDQCHGTLAAHNRVRSGTKLCLTCHTWQHADPQTVDPTALAGATPATNPNPLELGRLAHRIHRGKNLPTLFLANTTAAFTPPATSALPQQPLLMPFAASRNTALLGQKFSVVGDLGHEYVFGQMVSRSENGQPARTLAWGITFPRDLRSCGACHLGAAQVGKLDTEVSRRSCAGCHPDVWFGTGAPDQVHFAHPGGPMADDTQCASCHVLGGSPGYAPISELHVPPYASAHFDPLTIQIVGVQGLLPGQSPTVIFVVSDRDGALSPLNAPTPAASTRSLLARAITRLSILISGPTSDYQTGNLAVSTTAPVSESVPLTLTSDASGFFHYTFKATIPATAVGTWAVGIEARRSGAPALYDAVNDRFNWPYTGESVTETGANPIVYVDSAAGNTLGGSPLPRRKVVAQANCEVCHERLSHHGARLRVDYCLLCHAPDETDWTVRPKDTTSGNVSLPATWDAIEERTVHFKVLIHRMHTGVSAGGSVSLELSEPYLVSSKTPVFLDFVRFPGNLSQCTLCHLDGAFLVENVPADAAPTVANETGVVLHQGKGTHVPGEPARPPITAACMGCHDTGTALVHCNRYTTAAGVEQCAQCHSKGTMSVKAVHGLP